MLQMGTLLCGGHSGIHEVFPLFGNPLGNDSKSALNAGEIVVSVVVGASDGFDLACRIPISESFGADAKSGTRLLSSEEASNGNSIFCHFKVSSIL